MKLLKYPRTRHIEGSRIQLGDEDLDSVPFAEIRNQTVVVEEKLDGANSAISFDQDGQMFLQSRGHYLEGGARERHFNLFKKWAAAMAPQMRTVLSERYILYGEWLYAKHTIFYDRLPHYWFEFDVFDRESESFLSTARRKELTAGLPIVSAPVLFQGVLTEPNQLLSLFGRSRYISSGVMESFQQATRRFGIDEHRSVAQTDMSGDMEGLYIKIEEDGIVKGRFKFVRGSFLAVVADSDSHWLARPILPNQLADGVDIFNLERSCYD